MKKKVLPVILSLLMLVTFIPTAFAEDDTTPPVLTGAALDKSAYNLGDAITLTVQAADPLSGFKQIGCYAHFSGGGGYFVISLNELCEGGLRGSKILSNLERGYYSLDEIRLIDGNGNEAYYYHRNGLPDIGFTLTSDYKTPPLPAEDPAAPVITSYKLSKRTAYVGDTVTITITAKHQSGIASMSMQLMPNMVAWFDSYGYDIPLTPVQGTTGTFSGKFTVTADMPECPYYDPYEVVVTSNSGKSSFDNFSQDWVSLKVVNPNHRYIYPQITSYSMSDNSFVQGETITLTMSISDRCEKIVKLKVYVLDKNKGENSAVSFILYRQPDGTFTGTGTIPLTMKKGNYALFCVDGFTQNGDSGGVHIPDYLATYVHSDKYEDMHYLKGSGFTISPALTVSGTGNQTILAGSSFDAMAGVTANNYYTGDITDKIVVTGGDFDTNVPGMYLIKYIITDNVPYNGTNCSVTYTDYRWIGITEIMPDTLSGSSTPLTVTDGSLVVGASSSDTSVKKDGSSIAFSGTLTEPGKYTFTCGGSESSSSLSVTSMGVNSLSISNTSSVAAVIDKYGPTFKTMWLKNKKTGNIDVCVKPADVSGTAEIRYMAGEQSVDVCRSGGTLTDGKFSVPGYGKYTVYTKDGLGNESVKVLNINKSFYGIAYLDGVTLSAGTLTKAFSSTRYSYNIKLAEHEGSVTITPVKLFESEGMTIDKKAIDQKTVTVKNGKSVTVKVRVKLGKSSKTYTFIITRAKSTDATLKSLTATAGTFNTAFDPESSYYVLTLDKDTSSVRIKAAVNGPYAKASPYSIKYTLKPGQTKTIRIKVKAQSGAVNYYAVKIIRASS